MTPPDICDFCGSSSDTLVRCLQCSFWVCPKCLAYDGLCKECEVLCYFGGWDDDEEEDDDWEDDDEEEEVDDYTI